MFCVVVKSCWENNSSALSVPEQEKLFRCGTPGKPFCLRCWRAWRQIFPIMLINSFLNFAQVPFEGWFRKCEYWNSAIENSSLNINGFGNKAALTVGVNRSGLLSWWFLLVFWFLQDLALLCVACLGNLQFLNGNSRTSSVY